MRLEFFIFIITFYSLKLLCQLPSASGFTFSFKSWTLYFCLQCLRDCLTTHLVVIYISFSVMQLIPMLANQHAVMTYESYVILYSVAMSSHQVNSAPGFIDLV